MKGFAVSVDKEVQFLMYSTPQEDVKVGVVVKDETIWLTQKAMALLFGVDRSVITKHLKNIFETNELNENSVCAKIAHTAADGKKYNTQFYNLDAIISVGYRVNSVKATKFRIWATQIIKEYMTKGFALDDERLKQGKNLFGKDHLQELLDRVRSIRTSERRIWLKITDIFAELSQDYYVNSQTTKKFYAIVQNKFHFAITGKTAPEIIFAAADSKKENMGLTTWKNAPKGRILKSDTTIAKNYLSEKEIRRLERAVNGFFDYIEDLIEEGNVSFTMDKFAESINKFLEFREFRVLQGAGKITRKLADEKAETEYDEFNKTQKIESDFEKEVEKLIIQQEKH